MKKMIFAVMGLTMLLTFNSCDLLDGNDDGMSNPFASVFNDDLSYSPCEEDLDVSADELPDAIFTYLEENYPGYEIDDLDQYLENGEQRFGVEIDYSGGDIELLFTAAGDLINAGPDGEDVMVDASQLPQSALDYLDMEFPNAVIEEVYLELEYGYEFFEVELSNDVDVYFTADGTFACSEEDDDDGDDDDGDDDDGDDDDGDDDDGDDDGDDDDGDDDDGDDDDGDDDDGDDDDGDDDDGDDDGDDDDEQVNLSDDILNYISENYPGYSVDYASLEEYCAGEDIIEVEIEMGSEDRELYFSQDGTFLFEEFSMSPEALPQVVADALQAEYPGYGITDADRLALPDGSTRYWVEVENFQTDDEWEVIIEADGTIVCSFED